MELNVISAEKIHEYLTKNFVTFEHLRRATDLNREEIQRLIKDACIPGPSYVFRQDVHIISGLSENSFECSGNETEFFAPSVIQWIWQAQDLAQCEDPPAEIYRQFEASYFDSLIRRAVRPYGLEDLFDGNELALKPARASAKEAWDCLLKGVFGICIQNAVTADSIVRKTIATYKVAALTENGSAPFIESYKKPNLISALKEFDQIVSRFAPHDWPNSSRKRLFDDLVPRYCLQHDFPNFRISSSPDHPPFAGAG